MFHNIKSKNKMSLAFSSSNLAAIWQNRTDKRGKWGNCWPTNFLEKTLAVQEHYKYR